LLSKRETSNDPVGNFVYGSESLNDDLEDDLEIDVDGNTTLVHTKREEQSLDEFLIDQGASKTNQPPNLHFVEGESFTGESQERNVPRKKLSASMERYFSKILDKIEFDERYAEEPKYKAYGITPAVFKLSFELFRNHFMHDKATEVSIQSAFYRLSKPSHGHNAPTPITEAELMYKMYLQDVMIRFPTHFVNQRMVHEGESDILQPTDLKKPHEWYTAARSKKRKIIVHTGPTNSGKTHGAFERLKGAKSGVYCAPLRLLATEGYVKLTEQGVKCNLMTGDYKVEVDGATHISSTVEMVDVNTPVDVAVIDEIQLIGDEDRGWAWTRVLLGINAEEIHVCGEERALKLIEHLCSETEDELEVKHYKRLTPLKVTARSSIDEDYKNIREGDCVVAFSRKEVFRIKHEIERNTNLRVAVVYGSLPPRVRLEQSRLFNSVNSAYDVLVATDAIGMGLNLNIRRIVFNSVEKFDGTIRRQLEPWEIRQIAGRAGRFGSLYPKGEVTCLKSSDCKILQTAFMMKQLPDIEAAGLFPPIDQVEYFTRQFSPEQKLSVTLDSFYKLTETDPKYFMCNIDDRKAVADLLHTVKELTFHERMQFLNAPVDTADSNAMRIAKGYARHHSQGESVPLMIQPPEKHPQTMEQLREVESIYKILDVYCWLSYRFVETFVNHEQAREHQKVLLEMIQKAVSKPVNRTFLQGDRSGKFNVVSEQRRYRREKLRLDQDRLVRELEEYGIFDDNSYGRNRKRAGNKHQYSKSRNQRSYRR